MTSPRLGHVVLYVRDTEAVAAFYCEHFAMTAATREGDRITELRGNGACILLHSLGKGRKTGQSLVKLVFDVPDVEAFVAAHADFGPVHKAEGYVFANGRDPAGNPVQVSSRAFASWQDKGRPAEDRP